MPYGGGKTANADRLDGLDSTGFVQTADIMTAVGDPGADTKVPSEQAVREALAAFTGSANITTVGTLAGGSADAIVSAASESAAGKVELAAGAEVNAGADAARAISPDAVAGSTFGIRYLQATCVDYADDVATGNGQWYLHIPPGLDEMHLVYANAAVITAGATNATLIQVHNVTDNVDLFLESPDNRIAIASGATVGTPGAIIAANAHADTDDIWRIDVDQVSTTAPKGLVVTLGFQLP